MRERERDKGTIASSSLFSPRAYDGSPLCEFESFSQETRIVLRAHRARRARRGHPKLAAGELASGDRAVRKGKGGDRRASGGEGGLRYRGDEEKESSWEGIIRGETERQCTNLAD